MSGNTNQFEWAKNIPCRNIQIHGFCKWENKGCSFNHDTVKQNSDNPTSISTPATTTNAIDDNNISNTGNGITTAQSAPITESSSLLPAESNSASNSDLLITPQEQKAKFNFDIPSFTPNSSLTTKFAALSPSLNEIPSFIPSSVSTNISNNNNNTSNPTTTTNNINANNINIPVPESKSQSSAVQDPSSLFPNSNTFNPETAPVFTPSATVPALPSSSGIDQSIVSPSINSHILNSNYINSQPELIRSTEEQLFYQNTNLFPMNYHLYSPQPPPHIEMNKKENERTVNDLFIDSKLREYLQQKNESSLRSISNNQLDIPLHVNEYHSLYPIDHNFENSEKSYGYNSFIYKCLSNIDGKLYCMRRLENVPITSAEMLKSVKKWKLIDCANIVKIYQVFTTRAFGDNSLILIYDYFPMSYNLLENHFLPPGNKNPELITEDSLWSYTIQLLNAITEVKKNGLNIGPMDPSKIILTNKGRIRISSIAIRDIVKEVKNKNHNNNNNSNDDNDDNNVNKENDENDLLNLGGLIFLLAKSTTFIRSTGNEQLNPLEIIPQLNFTSVFKKMLSYLFQSDSTIEKFQELVAPQILKVTNGLQNSCDFMEANLMKELENARLVRLFSKLDFISERPEFVKDGSWSETGERYPIKLFKDYVFHQVDGRGEPVIDLTHVINCLNKLDAGVDENLLLVSPDEMTCLIMSYSNLKELVESSFQKLLGRN